MELAGMPTEFPPLRTERAPASFEREGFGRSIRGYELRERLGEGAHGFVYRAYQASIGREVAVKVIRPEFANRVDFVKRFEAEAQFIAQLEHPHIVSLYDYWRDVDGAYLAMQLLRGGQPLDVARTGTVASARSTAAARPDRHGTRLRPSPRRRPPGSQAGQRAARRRGQCVPERLRYRDAARGSDRSADREFGGLRVARGTGGSDDRSGCRRVRAGAADVRDVDRRAPGCWVPSRHRCPSCAAIFHRLSIPCFARATDPDPCADSGGSTTSFAPCVRSSVPT